MAAVTPTPLAETLAAAQAQQPPTHAAPPVTAPQNFVAALQAVMGTGSGRMLYTYNVPEQLAQQCGVRTVGLVELTADEELRAARRASGDPYAFAIQALKESVRVVDGVALSTNDLSAEQFWARTNPGMPRFRALVLAAYNTIHNPAKEDAALFLASREMTITR